MGRGAPGFLMKKRHLTGGNFTSASRVGRLLFSRFLQPLFYLGVHKWGGFTFNCYGPHTLWGLFFKCGWKNLFFKRIVKKPFINTAKLYRVIDSILIWFTIAFLFLGGVWNEKPHYANPKLRIIVKVNRKNPSWC